MGNPVLDLPPCTVQSACAREMPVARCYATALDLSSSAAFQNVV
jgi:hypothetical protein